MSQQILVRGSAPSRRGVSLVVIVVIIALLGGAIYGGLWWYSHKPAGATGSERTAADSVKSTLGELEDNLKTIETEKDAAKVDEAIGNIKTLADTDIADLGAQVAKAPAAVKTQVVALIAAKIKELQPLIDKAYAIPGVKEKLEPIIAKLMTALQALGA